MSAPIWIVDAFTSTPFAGNPAAVCVLDRERDDAWLQAVATEMNLSETAFVRRTNGADAPWSLRWFTPGAEVKLCGHATLATSHVLWSTGRLAPDESAAYATRSGILHATRHPDGEVELDFPALPCRQSDAPADLVALLGTTPKSAAFVEKADFGEPCWVLELEDPAAVRAVRPDLAPLRAPGSACLLVTAAAAAGAEASGADFVSRCFFPSIDVDEDPVTGAAHCVLAPFWAERFARRELVGFQASRRGGRVGLVVTESGRVRLRGGCVTVMHGDLEV